MEFLSREAAEQARDTWKRTFSRTVSWIRGSYESFVCSDGGYWCFLHCLASCDHTLHPCLWTLRRLQQLDAAEWIGLETSNDCTSPVWFSPWLPKCSNNHVCFKLRTRSLKITRWWTTQAFACYFQSASGVFSVWTWQKQLDHVSDRRKTHNIMPGVCSEFLRLCKIFAAKEVQN